MSCRAQFAWRWAGLLAIFLCSVLLFAQETAQSKQTPGRTVRTPLQINITGCLKKNAETSGYYISDENGRAWQLNSKKVDLSKHLFHTVSVSGHPASGANLPEGKSGQDQKTGTNPPLSLDVVELTMVSNSCTR